MEVSRCSRIVFFVVLCIKWSTSGSHVWAQDRWPFTMPESRHLRPREAEQISSIPLPTLSTPITVRTSTEALTPLELSLDEAIRIALENSEIIRVASGVSASSSGQSIYDTAITMTRIDEAKAVFDPNFSVNNNFSRNDTPVSGPDPTNPGRSRIGGVTSNDYSMSLGLSKQNIAGGVSSLDLTADNTRSRLRGLPLNPRTRSGLTLSYVHPFLEGSGIDVNLAPIVIARIDTERSYFQFKDAMQELVRSVAQSYWSVVATRVDVWALERQIEQSEFALKLSEARQKIGIRGGAQVGTQADVAQAESALASFRASRIAAKSRLISQEAALRNVLGLPPADDQFIVPTSPPRDDRFEVNWTELQRMAETFRPDLIELKLIIEADEQVRLQRANAVRPRLDGVMSYRWDGLQGQMPNGREIASRGDQFFGWTLGINFSVPIGLRQSRAALRRQELVIERDFANLRQGLHQVNHQLALNVRNLAQSYEQYKAFQTSRDAARKFLDQQLAEYRIGRPVILLNVLQAISTWGNAVSSEAEALIQYNINLANIERESGAILEAHGVYFYEERHCSAGPLGNWFGDRRYPRAIIAGENDQRYKDSPNPSEEAFDLTDPLPQNLKPNERQTPAPNPIPSPAPAPSGPPAPGPTRAPAPAPAPAPSNVPNARLLQPTFDIGS